MAFVQDLFWFSLLLGGLIFFHEFGHFIVARIFGVRVLEFSIGFGPKVGAFKRGDTVYRIGILPLGGYVKMLGADPMEEVEEEPEEGSFASKPLWQRSLVVLAGPVFNLILPLFVFFFFFLSTETVNPAVLGTLQPNGVADRAGMVSGDIIRSIDGEPIDAWWQLQHTVSQGAGQDMEVVVERGGVALPAISLQPKSITDVIIPELNLSREVGRIQIEMAYTKPVVVVGQGSAAAASGLESWDEIVAVDGEPVNRWEHVRRRLSEARGPLRLTVLREEALTELGDADGAYELATVGLPLEVVFDPEAGDATLGLRNAEFVIFDVTPGSPEAEAGLKRGDEIIGLNGGGLSSWGFFLSRIAAHPEWTHLVQYRRDGEDFDVQIRFERREVQGEFNTKMNTTIFGIVNRSARAVPDPIPNTHRLHFALHNAWYRTKHVFEITAASLLGLFTGQVGMEQMGGPIFIWQVASRTRDAGAAYFFQVMVWLSISLGLINLVPIPLLDGGHLLFFLIEAIKRGPVSLRTRQIAAYIGFSAIILLMLLVFRNDIMRVWFTS